MTLAAGKLRHWVALQRPVSVQDSSGDMVHTWETVRSAWAAIEPLSGREFIAAAANQSEVTGRITIRFCTDILPTWRILHNTKAYSIHAILSDKNSGMEYLSLPVSQGVTDGL